MTSKKPSNGSLTKDEEENVAQTVEIQNAPGPESSAGTENQNQNSGQDMANQQNESGSSSVPSNSVVDADLEYEDKPVPAPVSTETSKSHNKTTAESAAVQEHPNNNCMALLPISSKNQMIPIALLRKQSAGSVEGNGAGGLMQIITGTNKVAPAVTNPETVTTVGAAVLMLVPKKSDAVCVDIHPEQDHENNPNCKENVQQGPNTNNSQSDHGPVKPTQSYDSYEEVCRICHDNPSKMELISPCLCKGSMSKVHRHCLERWLGESAKNSCEICGYEYNTVRKPKYTGCSSIYQWIRHPLSPSDTRNLFFDIACFFILTPLAAISSWLCVVGAQHYTFGDERRRRSKFRDSRAWSQGERTDASNATWTSVGLLSLTGTLLVAYSVWLFVAIKYHIQAWRDWQQRNFTVTIVPFEDGMMGHPPPPRDRNASAPNNGHAGGGGGAINNNAAVNNNTVYNFESNPNFLHYADHATSVGRGGRGRQFIRHGSGNRHRAYNLPSVFNRNHFLRNPPPGYTISETTMLYQALYGSESESFFNENLLAFLAESSENVTEESSLAAVGNTDWQVGGIISNNQLDEQRQQQSELENESNKTATRSDTPASECLPGPSKNNNAETTKDKVSIHLTRPLNTSAKAGGPGSSSPNSDRCSNDSSTRDQTVVIPITDDVSNKNTDDQEIV